MQVSNDLRIQITVFNEFHSIMMNKKWQLWFLQLKSLKNPITNQINPKANLFEKKSKKQMIMINFLMICLQKKNQISDNQPLISTLNQIYQVFRFQLNNQYVMNSYHKNPKVDSQRLRKSTQKISNMTPNLQILLHFKENFNQ